MYQCRKFTRRNLLFLLSIGVVYLLLDHYFNGDDYGDNREKLVLIEESIKSLANQGACKMPSLPVDSPEMLSFLKDEPPIECGSELQDWVECEKAVCNIKPEVIKEKGKITCDYADILRQSDFKMSFGETTRTSGSYTLQASDFVRAKCWTDSRTERWQGLLVGIRQDEQLRARSSWNKESALNVLMLGFDSLSRNAFQRKLPKAYKYLTKYLGADVLQGYNIVGDGTPQALIPLLTGFTELELPDTRRRMKNTEYVNVYPLIWKEYEKYGYVTAFNEDVPNIGTFSYRLNGFDEQPTDHYMRTYYLAIEAYLSYYKRLCIGAKPRHKVMLDYTRDFMTNYRPSTPRFVFSFHGELSHDSINLVGVADTDLTNWLVELKKSGVLNNTILVLMSDHGNRFAEVRNTLQGKQEERLPFFSFTFPDWFKTHYKEQYENFRQNLDRLVTPFDVHETLQDILTLQTLKAKQKPAVSRAISLFDAIPQNRSCADAYIEPHWCACLNWQPINDTTSSEEVFRSAKTIVDTINHHTERHRGICAMLTLDEIRWAARLQPHEGLVRFKQNRDTDGFLGDFSSDTIRVPHDMYQVKLVTNPSKAIYEASVLHDRVNNRFRVKLGDISRINKYGEQANCIYERDPEMRKFCYCKDDH
ncbi:uncharacterized protein LOC125765304 [Anopheles funestus]|uniref:uncharacterized protein LOC125765304 n=1 Tax=Anopheles funestus TaxID=62324 RepID=UPI0020C6F875|nr:uncharacterized protein LOC125765304 [Anopheles funestus]XP_049286239.1 uncharacterized protein LOC125765304 [Anopheles funestus]XP_049286240.1 uncharacterized protein LOC125765304 [Anopheles funestus]XP_049286241.1 uncharacterized protein LOC125765304 [Anopheles funestus]XP_049286242.1 uncharacterized protein LOC125765304 [Anopheles funestus]XP_049286243.1 uncharacterized protein LOC125765304 [Anopheles funestus]XP_049286244.1 uncharacterized protein LOC125765304 [Anopheles funestus]